ncbi:hypothetical protein BCR44DRAFT_347133 [Catenaria anguillulae PL171]|uniref:Uncharacterized protein n=1 Tax=Catenaria anguillulae PL171 TaxID=765915 RepID=A0A1Y2H7L1_9FUNG|nr:hypothetical protein BCR44DRAFT_347133 [Catenaria anguillulae PL171]
MLDDPNKSIFDMAKGIEQQVITRTGKHKPEGKADHRPKSGAHYNKAGANTHYDKTSAAGNGTKHTDRGRSNLHRGRDHDRDSHTTQEQSYRPRSNAQKEHGSYHAELAESEWHSLHARRVASPEPPMSHSRGRDHDRRSRSRSVSLSRSRSHGRRRTHSRSRSRDRPSSNRHGPSRSASDEHLVYYNERSAYRRDMARLDSHAHGPPRIAQREPCALCAVNKPERAHVATTHDTHGCRDRLGWLVAMTDKIIAGLSLLCPDELPRLDDVAEKCLDRLVRLFDAKQRASRDQRTIEVHLNAMYAAQTWRTVLLRDKSRLIEKAFHSFVDNPQYLQYFAPARQHSD